MDLTYHCIHVARNLSISLKTVHYVLKIFKETDEVSPKKPPENDGMRMHKYGFENPSPYLGEICRKIDSTSGVYVTCTPSTVQNHPKKWFH